MTKEDVLAAMKKTTASRGQVNSVGVSERKKESQDCKLSASPCRLMELLIDVYIEIATDVFVHLE